MSESTVNYGLIKPAETEFYSIEVFNSNSDIIDGAMRENALAVENALEKADGHGQFVDSSSTATNGYWFKLFDTYIPNATDANFSLTLSVQDLYGSISQYPTGLIDMNINIKSGILDTAISRLKWLCADRDVSGYLNHFAIHINTDTSNVIAALYVYNSVRYRSVRVGIVSSGTGAYSEQSLNTTFYKHNGHAGADAAIPTSGSIIYSVAGDYLHLLSSSVGSSSEVTGATSKAVKSAYDLASSAQNLASNAVIKSGDTMTGNLTVASGGIAVGANAVASGTHALAQGQNCIASAEFSSAMGRDNEASAMGAHATGANNISSGTFSSCIGWGNEAPGYAAFAGGMGSRANLCCELVAGRWNVPSSGSSTNWSGAGNAFVIGNGNNLVVANSFRVTNSGGVYALAAFNSTGADYAEYFEWLDGNVDGEDRLGYFVALEDGKIRIANDSDGYILGAVSAVPGVVGNSSDDNWTGMYLTDKWGRLVYEDVAIPATVQTVRHEAVTDGRGNIITDAWDESIEIAPARTEYRLAINPQYDPNMKYVPRSKRNEWCAVGLLGRLRVYDDGTCKAGGFCRPNAAGIASGADSGYFVISTDGELAEILFR